MSFHCGPFTRLQCNDKGPLVTHVLDSIGDWSMSSSRYWVQKKTKLCTLVGFHEWKPCKIVSLYFKLAKKFHYPYVLVLVWFGSIERVHYQNHPRAFKLMGQRNTSELAFPGGKSLSHTRLDQTWSGRQGVTDWIFGEEKKTFHKLCNVS